MRQKFQILLFSMLFFISGSIPVFAEEADQAAKNASIYGFWTLIPPLIAIILAFITKNVVLSLFLGVFSGAFLLQLSAHNAFMSLIQALLQVVQYILNSLADPWNAGIILQVLAIGGLIGLVTKMGGAKAVAESLAKRAKTPRSAQIITWLMGILVFFDDYANSLIVGPIMRPVTDKLKISREKLAFIVDATAAPIAGIMIVSTWIGYEVGLIKDAYSSIGQTVNAYGVFIDTIPFRFYNILILVFILAIALMMRDFGSMYQAEYRARTTGKVLADTAKPMAVDDKDNQPKEGIQLSIWTAIIPIGLLMILSFVGFYYNGYMAIVDGEDKELIQFIQSHPFSLKTIRETFGASDASVVLFQAALFSSIVAIIMGVAKRIFTVGEAIETWINGMKSLLITGVILLLAWSLSSTMKELGTAKYLVGLLSDKLPAFILPSIIFILGAIISFATGTSYGTMGILMPLTIPLAAALSPDPKFIIMSAGAVLTGAIFGDHASPISDTTILSSMGAGSDHLDHVRTQLDYALPVAFITVLFGYLPVGLGVSVWIALPIAILAIFLLVRFVGKPLETNESTVPYPLREAKNAE
ncbi:Na+/H+ antiporter NhaC family protein [Tepidibacillus fermentans]|uniref:Transporter (NhaC family) n=1 Tax=Tepidibacillus fermentans TaxID=1281767 RepID=A0A4R3KBG0_9BACI|nr:Na+/H+ antiporter NhaC family protein [Tepidibacillus fermentans]TCS80397.1 transporter (NhaC family) [Tepidibacillus fermentans]